MALETMRVSSSNTLVMTCCSRAASTPARAPASIIARMSSEVMRSSRSDDRPSSRNSASAHRLYSHTTGRSRVMLQAIGWARRMAICSGWAMPRRLGNRSENRMNSDVMTMNDARNPTVCAVDSLSHSASRALKCGLSAPSPTMPPRIATAFCPICTTVK